MRRPRVRQLARAVVRRVGLAQVHARAAEKLWPLAVEGLLRAGGGLGGEVGGDPVAAAVRRGWAR